MYFIVDRDGIILSVNKYGAQHLGYEQKELVGKHVQCVIHQDDIKHVKKQMKQCVNKLNRVFEWEFRKICKDGSVLYVKESARAIRNEAAEAIILIVCEDITHDIELNTQLEIISLAFHSSSSAMVITDSESTILLANNAFKILAHSEKKTSGMQKISDLFIDPYQFNEIHKATLQSASWHGELKIRSADDKFINILLRTSLIKDDIRKYTGIAWSFADISDRILEDQELYRMREKTAIVEKKAIIGQLTSRLMHEINNPLHIILGKLYFLERNVSECNNSQQLYDHLGKIREQVYRINTLVKNTQNFTRQNLKYFDTLDVNLMIDKNLNSIGKRLSENIRLHKYYQMGLPNIVGDEINLGLAVTNIFLTLLNLSNDENEILIYSSLVDDHSEIKKGRQQEKHIEIRIEDTNSYIAENDLASLFDPLIDKKSINSSNSLGLTIAKDIIEKHYGHLHVESHLNMGTKFIITLPINQ